MEKKKTEGNAWGYLVGLGTVITFIAGIGHVNSFGLIYHDFMNDTNSTAKSLTSAYGVFSIMLAIGGIILNNINKKRPLRTGGLIGATLLTIGSFLTIFITNTNQLLFTFGILQGIGFGIVVPVCYSTLNYYFVKKRTTVMSLCKAAQGILLMWYPQLIKNMISTYGFRGTLLVVAGISLHVYPGMLTMQTEEVKPRKIARDNIENGITSNEVEDLLCINNNNEVVVNANKTLCQKISDKLMDVLNVKILRDIIFCNICIGQSFVNFSDLTFFMLQPMLLFQYGYKKTDIAVCISIGAAADLIGRCILALISSMANVNTRCLFYIATLFTFFIRIVMLQITEYTWMATVTGILGVLRAWLHVTSPLLISNHVEHKDFPGAYALSMLATGTVNVTFSPLIGLLKDVYHDYVPAFYALTVCCVPCLVLWPIEYIVKK
ncbi:unnamed protein product [Arctia plantaginis]|uniref:Monocarboxylate transporter n=1 Tax=Arctia plantaginis TaxID=874455 RepID=A0A8S1B3W8_ARCPL|nr:unnamed protein product [Arctia plantaginis]